MPVVIGTAGWNIPRNAAAAFDPAGSGSHLERYARVLAGVEVNSSFYRPHRHDTWARWAASTPPGFRFAAKLPRTLTHEARLRVDDAALDEFLAQVGGLGDKLAVLLVQLPPSLAFDRGVADDFFARLRARSPADVACEPRHPGWFTDEADAALARARVARVAADPAVVPAAACPGGWRGERGAGAGALAYFRWHGSPRTYWSRYDDAWLHARAAELARLPATARAWCIFDNTGAGEAAGNALALAALLDGGA
jgi:uncharacterized protein YecE (DUF72 family)